jgi:hypothetical protein
MSPKSPPLIELPAFVLILLLPSRLVKPLVLAGK